VKADQGSSLGESPGAAGSSSAVVGDGETTGEATTDKGVEKALAEMMPKVIERLRVCAEEAVSAGAAGDFATAGRMGHTIEGLGMTFGLIQAERLGREMEAAARDGDMARLQHVNAEVGEWLQAGR
jgi:hypothetical protein